MRRIISEQEARVYRHMKGLGAREATVREVAEACSIARRTADEHLRNMAQQGILAMRPHFPGFRYRWTTKAPSHDGKAYQQRLEQAVIALAEYEALAKAK